MLAPSAGGGDGECVCGGVGAGEGKKSVCEYARGKERVYVCVHG